MARRVRTALAALLLVGGQLIAASPAAATSTCGWHHMRAHYTAVDTITYVSVSGTYDFAAYTCWENGGSWPPYGNYDTTVTYVSGAQVTSYTKGAYVMADGTTTDHWANMDLRVQCSTFPFQVQDMWWYPRIKVNGYGTPTYDKGYTQGTCNYALYSYLDATW